MGGRAITGPNARRETRRRLRLAVGLAMVFTVVVALNLAASPARSAPGPAPLQTLPADFETGGPLVECVWLLPDADRDATDGIQYEADDQADVAPMRGGCRLGTEIVASGERHLAQVVANPADAGGPRQVEVWSAVTSPDGASGVDAVTYRVFYPDGSFKAELTGDRVDLGSCDDLGVEGPGDTPQAGSMFAAAVASAQVTRDSAGRLAADCAGRIAALYRATIELSYLEPCGEYRLEAHASANGDTTVAVHHFDVACAASIAAAFDRVSWGVLVPGTTKWLLGPERRVELSADAPQLSNFGSGGVEIGVRFAPMKPINGEGEPITEFGVAVVTAAGAHEVERIPAGKTVWLGAGGIMCAGERAVLDAAVHPGAGLGTGDYSGSMEVLVRAAGTAGKSLCTNDNGRPSTDDQRTPAKVSGPAPTDPVLPAAAPSASTTTTEDTTTTTAVEDSTTTTTVAEGSTTTTTPPEGSTTTTTTTTTTAPTTTTTTTTTTTIDPTASYPIPYVSVEGVFDSGTVVDYDVRVYIQPGVSIPGSDFDLTSCLPLYHLDGTGDGHNDGDANRDGALDPGEAWVFRCGFGEGQGDDLPFDPIDIL